MSTVRLTVGQAIVRFLAQQYVERDGEQNRFIAGVWGIFGHGNVAGLGQALEELGDECEMPYYRPQNEQAQVHLAAAYAKHKNRMQTFACTSSIGPGATNMITGAATATVNRLPVLLFPSDYFANRLVDPVLQQVEHPDRARRLGLGRLPPGLPLLRPDLAPRAAHLQPARGVPRPHGPGRDRRRDDLPARGRPGRGLRLARALLRASGSGGSAGRAPRRSSWTRWWASSGPRGARSSWPAAARSTPVPRRPWTTSRRRTGSRWASRRPARASLPWNHPQNVGPDRVGGRPRGQPPGQGRRPGHRRRHPHGRLRHGLPDRVPGPGRDLRRDQHQRVRRGQDALRAADRRRTRGAHGDRRGPRRGRPPGHARRSTASRSPPSRRSGTSG